MTLTALACGNLWNLFKTDTCKDSVLRVIVYASRFHICFKITEQHLH